MRVGIIGSGPVGQALGRAFVKEGHEAKVGSKASAGTFADVAKFGELAVLATRWEGGATENAIKLADPKNLAGKVVIDATNPLKHVPNAPPGLALGYTDSAGEQVQRWLPGARVARARSSRSPCSTA